MDRERTAAPRFSPFAGALCGQRDAAVRGVVYLWGLDAPSIEGLTLARLKNGSEMMCRGALAILHALAETRSTNPLAGACGL